MNDSRVHIMRRKADVQGEQTIRKKLVDILRASTIIDDRFSGTLELTFHQGGLRGSKLTMNDPI